MYGVQRYWKKATKMEIWSARPPALKLDVNATAMMVGPRENTTDVIMNATKIMISNCESNSRCSLSSVLASAELIAGRNTGPTKFIGIIASPTIRNAALYQPVSSSCPNAPSITESLKL